MNAPNRIAGAVAWCCGVRIKERDGKLHVKISKRLARWFPGRLDVVVAHCIMRYPGGTARRLSDREYLIWVEKKP